MAVNIKGFIYRSVFFLGWLLSPLTFWNDAFVNIPLAYICASLIFRLAHFDFLLLVLAFYWASNILGLALMYLSGRAIVKGEGYSAKMLLQTILTVVIYSAALMLLSNLGILRPFRLPGN